MCVYTGHSPCSHLCFVVYWSSNTHLRLPFLLSEPGVPTISVNAPFLCTPWLHAGFQAYFPDCVVIPLTAWQCVFVSPALSTLFGKVQSSVNVSNVVGAKSRNKNVYRTFRQLEREKTNPNIGFYVNWKIVQRDRKERKNTSWGELILQSRTGWKLQHIWPPHTWTLLKLSPSLNTKSWMRKRTIGLHLG